MAELADAPDLGSGGRPCRFKSCYPHKIRDSEAFVAFGFLIFMHTDAERKYVAKAARVRRASREDGTSLLDFI